jgi:glycosyltransferase involved in cell wall biosynthesis
VRSLFIISATSGYGGAERQIEVLVKRLQRDVELTVCAISPTHVAALAGVLQPPSRLLRLCPSESPFGFTRQVLKVAWNLRAAPPDAILLNNYRSAMILAAAALLLRRVPSRIFIYVHDFAWHDLRGTFALLPTAHVLIPSQAVLDAAEYLAPFVVPRGRQRCSTLPNAIDLPASGAAPSSGGFVLHLATVNPWKGHTHLIRAAALLKGSGRPLDVLSVGPSGTPELQAQLERELADTALGARFSFGYAADPSELLRNCLCVVVVSVSDFGGPETFGRSIIEAWAHRKPVVAFAAGGPSYLVEHEKDGLLVTEGDTHGLAEALWRLRSDPDLCRRLGEAGFAKVQAFTAERVAGQLRELLETPAETALTAARRPSRRRSTRRNDPCPCGSGRKYKHCHRKYPWPGHGLHGCTD